MRIGHSLKDYRRAQNVHDLEERRRIEAVNEEHDRMDMKAEKRAGVIENLKRTLEADEIFGTAKAREEMELRTLKLAQQEQVAIELAKLKREEFVELKLRQQLRESSMELRELEAKLRTAYVNKDLAAQLEEKKMLHMCEKMEERRALELMLESEKMQREANKRRMEEELRIKLQYKQDLLQQMCEVKENREKAFQKFLRDKLMCDEVARLIQEEEMREEEMRMIQKKKTKEEMDYFRNAREAWVQKEKQRAEDEDRRLIEYWIQKDAEAGKAAAEENRAKEILEHRQKIISDYLLEIKKKQESQQEMIDQLCIEERMAAEEERCRAEMEEAIRRRLEVQRINEEQRRMRLEQLRRESEMDEQFRQQTLMKFAEDERIEQMTQERRRQKILDHKNAVDNMIRERQRKREEEAHELKALQKLEEEQLKIRQKMIEDERLRILQEHAKHVLGYLPKGVLKPDDFPHISSTIIERQKKQNESGEF